LAASGFEAANGDAYHDCEHRANEFYKDCEKKGVSGCTEAVNAYRNYCFNSAQHSDDNGAFHSDQMN
jgi:hypothetical protein